MRLRTQKPRTIIRIFSDNPSGASMKSASFIFDRRLYELLQEQGRTTFTIRELRDAYAARLNDTNFRMTDVRRYVYEHIRRLQRAGLVVPDEERRVRGQVFHLQPTPTDFNIELVDNGFENSIMAAGMPEQDLALHDLEDLTLKLSVDTDLQLEALHKEIRLDFLTSMGEAERFKLLLNEMPHLRDKVEGEYLEARDRSSRLLGHLRAIEKTLKTLAAPR